MGRTGMIRRPNRCDERLAEARRRLDGLYHLIMLLVHQTHRMRLTEERMILDGKLQTSHKSRERAIRVCQSWWCQQNVVKLHLWCRKRPLNLACDLIARHEGLLICCGISRRFSTLAFRDRFKHPARLWRQPPPLLISREIVDTNGNSARRTRTDD